VDGGTEWTAWLCPWVLPGEALRKGWQSPPGPALPMGSVKYPTMPGLVGPEWSLTLLGMGQLLATPRGVSPTGNKGVCPFLLGLLGSLSLAPMSKCSIQRQKRSLGEQPPPPRPAPSR
jgi:hypothetical protein